MPEYIASKNIDDEAKRLSLISIISNRASQTALAELKKNHRITTILDVGCGVGDCFKILKTVFPQASIAGVDQSAQALKLAVGKGADKLIQADITKLMGHPDLINTHYNLIFIRNTLAHIPNPEVVLRQAKLITARGDIFFIQEPNWNTATANWNDFKIFKNALMSMMKNNNINPTIGQNLKTLLNNLGLKNIISKSYNNTINPEDKTWDILESLLEVSGDRITPYLQKEGVKSVNEMVERLHKAKENPRNSYKAPAWVVAYGEIFK